MFTHSSAFVIQMCSSAMEKKSFVSLRLSYIVYSTHFPFCIFFSPLPRWNVLHADICRAEYFN